jgi:hypothetical protein
MKSSKLVLIAAIIACFTVNMARADGFPTKSKKIIFYHVNPCQCTLVKACQCPELLEAILEQVEPWFLFFEPYQKMYTVKVICNNYLWLITGTREEWIMFGELFWGKPPKELQPAVTIKDLH